MSDANRPVLGAEVEVALAKVDLTQTLTLADAQYPAIVGSFEVITCVNQVDNKLPSAGTAKALRCGYNPAAHLIPDGGELGQLTIALLDKPAEDKAAVYHDTLCVARLVATIDGVAVRTVYCSYYTPLINEETPEGDNPATATMDGRYLLYRKAA